MADVVITGDDVDQQIKENAVIDITVKVDASEQMTIEAYFPETDTTVEKKLDTSKLQSVEEAEKRIPRDLAMAQNRIDRLKDEGCDTSALQDALDRVKEEADNSSEKKAVLQHLKEVLRKIEDLDGQTEWNRLERQLREEFDRLEKANNDLGNEKTTQLVNQLRTETDNAIRAKDVKIGREVLENIKSLFFQLTMIYQLIGLIESCSRQFGQIRWKDAARARQLVNMGMSEISNQPAVEKLQPIAVGLLDLMPDNEARRMGSGIKNVSLSYVNASTAFDGCANLESATFWGPDEGRNTFVLPDFRDCPKLKKIVVNGGGWDLEAQVTLKDEQTVKVIDNLDGLYLLGKPHIYVGDYPNYNFANTILYVPKGMKNVYRENALAPTFKDIVELTDEQVGIIKVTMDGAAENGNGDAVVYDLSGQRVLKTVPGNVYVSKGRKFIAK